jgi:ankyrin repeat protein
VLQGESNLIAEHAPEAKLSQQQPATDDDDDAKQQQQKLLDLALWNAAAAGNTPRCLELLESGANINYRRGAQFSRSPLTQATYKKKRGTALALLKARADPHLENSNGWSCQHWAACRNYEALCRELIEVHGVDTTQRNNKGATPLALAAMSGHAQLCTQMLTLGCDLDASASNNNTVLAMTRFCGVPQKRADTEAAIRGWLKDRAAAAAFARGTLHAWRTHETQSDWTETKHFDKHLIAEITSYVTPPPPACTSIGV